MQTISLKTAIELYKKGLRAESAFYWIIRDDGKAVLYYYDSYKGSESDKKAISHRLGDWIFPAYTLDELWGVMPDHIHYKNIDNGYTTRNFFDIIKTTKGLLRMGYFSPHSGELIGKQEHDNPTEAAGLMAIWLIDNGYMEVGGVKQEPQYKYYNCKDCIRHVSNAESKRNDDIKCVLGCTRTETSMIRCPFYDEVKKLNK